MSFLFGKKQSTKPSYTGLQLQTASSTQTITLLWGCNRISMNLIWYGDFKAHKKKQKAGKGMGGSSTYYTYSTSFQGGLCEGSISGVGTVYKDDEKTTLAALGMTLFTGTYPQAPWGYLSSAHPEAALNYEGIAYIAIANYDLGQTASLGNHSFEVMGRYFGSAPNGADADCAVVVRDFLTNEQYGAGFGLSRLDQDQLFSTPDAPTGDSSYQTYCTAMGFGLSPALGDATGAGDILSRWALLTNSAPVWNGFQLKMVPYVREAVTGNGVTYVPPQLEEPAYVLTMADFLEDPKVDRVDQSECPNVVSIKINNKDNEYNELPVEFRDQTLIDLHGERKGNVIDANEITDADMAAEMVGLIAARSCYTRNTYKFRLGQEYVLLEPMDVLGVVNASGRYCTIQIKTIEENEDDEFVIEAEEISDGVSSRGGFNSPGTANPTIINSGVIASPVNPPIIMEPAANLTGGVAQVWAAVSGGDGTVADPNWGGAEVYISTDDVTYQSVGIVDSPARMGKLTANMATGSLATAKVDLTMSQGELQGVTSLEALQGATLSYVGGELFAYTSATLDATYNYTLGLLHRGLNGTADAAHTTGTAFARLDENIFKFDLPAEYIGIPLYLKFQSFNIWNSGYQELEDCVAYLYEPEGTGFNIAPPSSVALAFALSTQADGTNIIKGTVTLGASAGPYLDHYDVQITTDGGTTWQDIAAVSAAGSKTSFEPATPSTNYQARSRAVSSATGGIPSAWIASTVVNSGSISGTSPNVPTGLVATGGILSNDLSWTAPASGSYVQGYRVFAIEDPAGVLGSATLVGTVTGNTNTKFTHTGLGPTETWRYWVYSFNLAGNSSTPVGPQNATTTDAGGGGSVAVQEDGLDVVLAATAINFTGDGVSVEEDPTGVAKVTITGGNPAAFELLVSATGTGVSQNITVPAGYTADQLLVFSGALFFPDFTLVGTTLTLTTNAVGDLVKVYAMVVGSAIGSGAAGYASIPRFRPNAGVGFGAGNYGGRVVTFDKKCKITHVSGYCVTNSPTSVVRPALYSVNPANGAINTLLVQGPQITGVAPGLFDLPLDSEYQVDAGDTVFVGFQVLTANLVLATQGDTIDTFFFASTGALPSTAPSATYGGATSMTVFPKVITSGGGGGGGEYSVLATWDFSTDGAMTNLTADVSRYDELLVVMDGVTNTVAGVRKILLSIDGVTFLNSVSTAYFNVDSSGNYSAANSIDLHGGSTGAARGGFAWIGAMKSSKVKNARSNYANYMLKGALTSPVKAVRFLLDNGGSFNGGTVTIYGKG